MEAYDKLKQATSIEDAEKRNTLLGEGVELIDQQNQYGWKTAMCYSTNPMARNCEDET